MNLIKKIKAIFNISSTTNKNMFDLEQRLARLERGYIVLLKRVLEMDGVQLPTSKIESFTSKAMQTPNDETNKGLNDTKPTLH